jgi:hypothetical protein
VSVIYTFSIHCSRPVPFVNWWSWNPIEMIGNGSAPMNRKFYLWRNTIQIRPTSIRSSQNWSASLDQKCCQLASFSSINHSSVCCNGYCWLCLSLPKSGFLCGRNLLSVMADFELIYREYLLDLLSTMQSLQVKIPVPIEWIFHCVKSWWLKMVDQQWPC